MNIRRLTTHGFLLAAIVLVATPAHSEASLYRYRNDKGILVVDFSIPARYVAQGYEVLSSNGRVLREVPPKDPELTPEVLERKQEQRKEDNYLLRSYSSLEAIERARNRKLVLVQREIDILESNLEDFTRRRAELREKAAGYQASGRETPASIGEILAKLDVHEQNTRELLAERRRELKTIEQRYDRYAERLLILRPGLADSASVKTEKGTPE